VQVHEQWCHMVELARISCESCCSVQYGLNPIKVTLRQSSNDDVTVVDCRSWT